MSSSKLRWTVDSRICASFAFNPTTNSEAISRISGSSIGNVETIRAGSATQNDPKQLAVLLGCTDFSNSSRNSIISSFNPISNSKGVDVTDTARRRVCVPCSSAVKLTLPFSASCRVIAANNVGTLTGLETNSSKPASRDWSISPCKAFAVNAIMGLRCTTRGLPAQSTAERIGLESKLDSLLAMCLKTLACPWLGVSDWIELIVALSVD